MSSQVPNVSPNGVDYKAPQSGDDQSPAPPVSPESFDRIRPRACRVCGITFHGLGSLCPVHLAEFYKQQDAEAKAGDAITLARTQASRTKAQAKRTEWREEI